MARPKRTPKGWRYQPIGPDGQRLYIAWPRISEREAIDWARKIDELIDCRRVGEPVPVAIRSWLRRIPDELAERLAVLRLAPPRSRELLGPFVDGYIERGTAKPSTKTTWRRAARHRVVRLRSSHHTAGPHRPWRRCRSSAYHWGYAIVAASCQERQCRAGLCTNF